MFSEFLQALAEPQNLPVLVAGAIIAIAVIALMMVSSTGKAPRSRLRQLHELRQDGMPQGRFHATGKSHVKDADLEDLEDETQIPLAVSAVSAVIGALPLLGKRDQDKIREMLNSAGVRRTDALGIYVTAKLIAYGLGGIGMYALISMIGFPEQFILRAILVLGGVIMAGVIPEIIVKRMIAARMKSIEATLPDALDLMVICTESGLSLDPTIERVAREIRLASPALAREFAVLSQEIRLLPEREKALLNFADRNKSKSVRSLVTTLVQTMKYGTSLAQSLRVLANESRNQRMLAVEEKAARLPALMSLPLVCCMLPAVFLVIGGPAVSQVFKL